MKQNRRPRRPILVALIIAVNIAVFLLWHLQGPGEPVFMENNFLISWQALSDGRYWTLLTAVFSHNWDLHILINMLVLWSFGSVLEIVLGPGRFLKFYLVAGIFSSFSHAALSNWLLGQPQLAALGASGAIAGLVLLFALMFPKQKIYLFAVIPIPALWGALAFVGIDLWGLTAQAKGGGLPIGHGAHLGGALIGVIYYVFFIRPRWLKNPYRVALQ